MRTKLVPRPIKATTMAIRPSDWSMTEVHPSLIDSLVIASVKVSAATISRTKFQHACIFHSLIIPPINFLQ